jgi:predicted Rossmann fold flavoprotein
MSLAKTSKNVDTESIWDAAVIGGGPSGMMAAARAAERGLKVILIEKNDTLGKKLLITGGGRCNVTNAEPDTRKLLSKFKGSREFLFSAFSKWSVKETLDFFHLNNMDTKVEALQRVFPVTNKSLSVWNVLVERLKKTGVTVLSNSLVTGLTWELSSQVVTGVKLRGAKIVQARNVILATGGKSHPETGSTGEGFEWLQMLGHKVIEPTASLVPIAVKDAWVSRVSGLAIQNAKITLLQNGVKQQSSLGRILFTHVGLSGPTILNLSSEVSELLKYGEVEISIDLLPAHDHGALNLELQRIFKEEDKKKFKNSLKSLVPSSLAPVIVELSDIDPDKQCNSVTREERLKLLELLKHVNLKVSHLLGDDKAIVTSGGVDLSEVDFKSMSSRLYPNLYLIGDVLNIDRPSGGYSLQLCWTTGFVAGDSVKA